jgi:tetratricopeptide (TPR) repeat protein
MTARFVDLAGLASQAMALVKAGQSQQAIALIETASASDHSDEAVLRVHAIAVAQQGDVMRAIDLLQPVFATNAASVQTQALAARFCEDAKRFRDAFEHYAKVVDALPTQLAFWRGLWRCALASGSDPIVARALSLVDSFTLDFAQDVGLSLALFRGRRRLCASDRDVEQCLALASALAKRFPNESEVLNTVIRFAIDAVPTRALTWLEEVAPSSSLTNAEAIDVALAMPQLFADEHAIDQWRARYERGLRQFDELTRGDAACSPSLMRNTAFSLAYQGHDDLALQCLRGDALARCVSAHTPTRVPRTVQPSERLRVGFVSKHIRDCTVGHYFRRFMSDLNGDEIEVHLYACGVTDAFTDAIAAHASHCKRFPLESGGDERDETLDRIAASIADDALDVLIYPEVGMEPLIEKLAAMRLAPLQCALWGHPDTTGLPTIDVFFTAEAMEPEHAQTHYRERLQRLPGLGCAYPRPPLVAPIDRATLSLPHDAVLFVCAQSSFKWRTQFVDTVAQMLIDNPNAQLVYFRNREKLAALAFDRYLDERLRAKGIDPTQRTHALAETTRESFLSILAACDIALDTFDFSGGNTTLDSLSVGLPVVTLPGEFMRGRQSMAMLAMIGANELVARDRDDYIRIANDLVRDANKRREWRNKLRASSDTLFDDERPIESLKGWLLAQRDNAT